MKHVAFGGRLVMVGCGSIGQGVLPLILRHIDIPTDRITIVTADERGAALAAEHGAAADRHAADPRDYREVLAPLVGPGDFLLNLSVDVSSVALITFAREAGALYLDTCIEPWAGGYTDPSLTPSQRSNYALRESAIALRGAGGPTAVITHGANPGLVSHLLKEALLNVARDTGVTRPRRRRARNGRCWPSGSASKPSTSPSATPRQRTVRRNRASSSTPGRSTASSARAASRPSWAGARMSAPCRRMGGATISAAMRRSICCAPAHRPACAPGRRWKVRSTAS